MTKWPEYKDSDFRRSYASMEKPAFVFDCRNMLPHRDLFELCFNLCPIGSPELRRFS